ncbi:MAG TPA: hypothetical protein VM261_21865 [Kofleriaceae bacterium]|nr:hypothetical protein [Kofleriaceae bacterium]
MRGLAVLFLAGTLAGLAGSAAAQSGARQVCAATEGDAIDVDGMLDDWSGVGKARAGSNAADASFDLRCLFDGTRLYLSIDVRDERVMRSGKTPDGEDRLEIQLAAGKAKSLVILAYPGKDRAAPRRLVAGKPAPGWLSVEDTLQPKGWSIELVVPLARVPGGGPSAPEIGASVSYFDSDVPKLAISENTVPWAGNLVLGNADSTLAAALASLKVKKAQLTLDATVDLDPTRPGPERVIAGGTGAALITDEIGFVSFPAAKAADVGKPELVDLAGDGKKHLAVKVRQHGGGGSREVLIIYGAREGKLYEVQTLEVGKEAGGNRLASTYTFESAKAWKQAKGARRVLVVKAGPATGWDEDTYNEAPAPDAEPIHVPWDDDRIGGVYWLTRDGTLASAVLKR